MKLTIKILASTLATLTLAFNISTASAASCNVTNVFTNLSGGGSASANACINHTGNDGGGAIFSTEINGLFGTSGTWSQLDKDDTGGPIAGTWDFSTLSITNPFVIVLKAGPNFAAYLFQVISDGTGSYITFGIDDPKGKIHDLSHISIYTNVGEVPIPAAIWLFGSALMGLVGIRKRYTA